MKKIMVAVAATALMTSTAFAAGNADAGKSKTGMCSACHGAAGISAIPTYPNLAGQKAAYIVKQLKDFKSGARKDATMPAMVAGLSEQDMADIAAYYSKLK